ncbi:MAG: endonuclease/exonuclease/phosphatase family protein, partial [Candidatus Hydrogenedentota bacterium]
IGRWRWVAASVVVLGIHAPGILGWYVARDDVHAGEHEPNVRVLIANVMTRPDGYEEVIDYIRERDPDVVLLQEISVDWMEGMRELVKERYPYARFEARFDNFGMATFSRFPATRMEMVDPLKMGIPVLDAVLEINGREVVFLNYHPMPPFDADHMEMRNRQLAYMGEHARAQNDLVVLAGDMNVTPWSPVYRDALADANLGNARQGFGVMPTWPALGLKIPVVPIDHCLVSPEIVVTHMERGPRWGSDHRALWVEMYVPGRVSVAGEKSFND